MITFSEVVGFCRFLAHCLLLAKAFLFKKDQYCVLLVIVAVKL
jgi:hypothetical protein